MIRTLFWILESRYYRERNFLKLLITRSCCWWRFGWVVQLHNFLQFSLITTIRRQDWDISLHINLIFTLKSLWSLVMLCCLDRCLTTLERFANGTLHRPQRYFCESMNKWRIIWRDNKKQMKIITLTLTELLRLDKFKLLVSAVVSKEEDIKLFEPSTSPLLSGVWRWLKEESCCSCCSVSSLLVS